MDGATTTTAQTRLSVLTCPECSASFRRAEHLKRHTLTHIDDKPHVCSFCDFRYKRSDALRRHWKVCAQRIASDAPIPKRSLSGKRKQACDRCTSRKRACSTGELCSECFLQGADCTYNGTKGYTQLEQDTLSAGGSTNLESLPLSRRRQRQKSSPKNGHLDDEQAPQIQFDFLLNFTRAAGLNEAYNYGSKEAATSPSHECSQDPAPANLLFDDSTTSNPFDCYLDDVEASLWGDSELWDPHTRNQSQHVPLLIIEKADKLWELLKPRLDVQTFNQSEQNYLDVSMVFAPENLMRYLDLFWSRWYQHCPIIHRATFDLGTCSTLLFATMSLIGACMSSQESDYQGAKQVLDVVEELIFSQPLFTATVVATMRKDDQMQTRQSVEALQATCFMCLLQKWEGNDAAKLRMQRHRFTSFVAITRAIGLSQATHHRGTMGTSISDAQWREWILKEEMIRTINHVFLLDSAFVIFHNSVPRMVLQEMTIDAICPEHIFQASSPEQFMIAIKSHPLPPTPPLLTDCVRTLCAEHPDPAILAYIRNESALALFTIVTAIHGLIFHQLRAFSPLPLATSPLRRALDRWEEAWMRSPERLADSDSLREGSPECAFAQRAREFALLARVHIQKSHLSTSEWNAMVQNLPEHVSRGDGESLATFDQTDMNSVADLILAVKHLDLK